MALTCTTRGVDRWPTDVSPDRRAPTPLLTDHLRKSIKRSATTGAIATGGGQAGQLVLTFVSNAVLARLLSPHEFGLVAMATVFAGFLHTFKEAGLSTATIQREDITEAQVSNLFWLNAALGGTAMLAMAAAAPFIARFFDQPALFGIATVMSVGLLLEALVVQHSALLSRQMRFSLLSGIDLGCTAAGLLVGVLMAVSGWGYWSLVGTTLSTVILKLTTVWSISRWRPQRPTRHSGTRSLVRFGTHLTLVGVLYSVSRSCDSLLIGRYLGSEAVGLYSRSTVLLIRPLDRLIWPIYSVMIPTLSRLQTEPERYRRVFLLIFEALAIAGFVLAGLLFPLSDALIRLILGEPWRPAAPIFAALTLLCLSRPLATATAWLCTSQGRGRDLLVTAGGETVISVAAFVVGLRFGTIGVAIAYSVSSLVAVLPLAFYFGGRTGPVTTHDLWLSVVGHVPVFVAVLAATWVAREWVVPTATPLLQVALCLTVGTGVGIATLWGFPRSRLAMRGVLSQLNDLRSNRGDA